VSTTAHQMPIVDGGNKFELFSQLGDIGRIRHPRPPFRLAVKHPILTGSLAPQVEVGVFVYGIMAEDGSGESWIINGYVFDDELGKSHWLQQEFKGHQHNFHGLYNTKRRSGFIYAGADKR
jgi:hypothetical protein